MNNLIKNFKTLLLLLLLLCFYTTEAQVSSYQGAEAEKIYPGASYIQFDQGTENLSHLRFKYEDRAQTTDLDAWLTDLISHFTEGVELVFIKKEKDNIGHWHHSYMQVANGIPVEHSIVKVHMQNDKIYAVNSEYYPTDRVSPKIISVTVDEAKERVGQDYVEGGIEPNSIDIDYLELLYLYDEEQGLRLCHKIDVYGHVPMAKREYVYIDVSNGDIVRRENRILHNNTIGVAHTKYKGQQNITVDSISSNNYRLHTYGNRAITTQDANNTTTNFTNIYDADNIWDTDSAAYDVHYGCEKTYDYYYQKFGRNSFDNAGARIYGIAHYDVSMNNAFWDGSNTYYGDGDGYNFGPFNSIDVVAHEVTHAVTQYTAGLVYADESGAINESYSDMFSVLVDYFVDSASANWLTGEAFDLVAGTGFRNYISPNLVNDPDTYQGNHWDFVTQEVHNNGTVHTHWLYLLCNGGTGVNDNNTNYSVQAIPMDDAAQIIYRALTIYLTPNSTYADARTATLQSAVDLFGACTQQEIQVGEAWKAVGVGLGSSSSISAEFSTSDTVLCSLADTIHFTDLSYNASTFYWDFGDGSTSTQASPSHVYSSPGTYSVQLIITGTTSCGSGADTVLKSNLIKVSTKPLPIAHCTSNSQNYYSAIGIQNFTLDSINVSSGDAYEGNMDFTCFGRTTLTTNTNYPFSVTPIPLSDQRYAIYCDYNNDGTFQQSEKLAGTTSNSWNPFTGIINFPSTAVLNTPLRLRVISSMSTIYSACYNIQDGQYEDYTVILTAPTSPPVADYQTAYYTIPVGANINLTDLSSNGPTSWNWQISGGTPSTNTAQNPAISFPAIGTYPVKLVACNSFGCDSITKIFTVLQPYNMCTNSSSNLSAGMLYDSGGPIFDYSSNENCTFLISPTGCTDSIKLDFNYISLEYGYDFIRVFDGPSISSPLLTAVSGFYNNFSVKGTSGEMLVELNSDAYIEYPGFEAIWTAYGAQNIPTSSFTYSGTQAPGSSIQFTSTSTGVIDNYLWFFGDGNSSTAISPQHQYAMAGNYTVMLIVDNCAGKDTSTQVISISSTSNSFTLTSYPCDTAAEFTAVYTSPPYTGLMWFFGDGTSVTGTNSIVYHTYPQSGTYDVTMIALNSVANDTVKQTITVGVPDGEIQYTGNTLVNSPLNFSVSSSSNLTSYDWSFGDGSTIQQASPSHTYVTDGTYIVSVEITDQRQCTTILYDTLDIDPLAIISLDEENNIKVFPNPFGSGFYIQVDDALAKDDFRVELHNSVGQFIMEKEISAKDMLNGLVKINVPEVSSGIYLLSVTADQVYTIPITKR